MRTNLATVDRSTGEVTVFDPLKAKHNIAKADAIAQLAEKLRDWPLLEKAIDAKLDEQDDVVHWWRENVTPRQSIGRKGGESVSGRSLIPCAEAESRLEITKKQVSRWATWLKRRDETRAELIHAAMKRQFAEAAREVVETLNTGDMEGYTPATYIEAARSAMGGINVDPASHARAQTIVQADTYYTKETNGLDQEWVGNVFLNPPYNSGLIEKFIQKLLGELAAGRTTAAILLTNNNTDTRWFHSAAGAANAICLTKGRINFYKPDSSITSPTNGQCFFYFGPRLQDFVASFSSIGLVLIKPYG